MIPASRTRQNAKYVRKISVSIKLISTMYAEMIEENFMSSRDENLNLTAGFVIQNF